MRLFISFLIQSSIYFSGNFSSCSISNCVWFISLLFLLFIYWLRKRGRGTEKHQFVLSLIDAFIGALTGDRTHNLGFSGLCSNRLSYSARAHLSSCLIPNLNYSSVWLSFLFKKNIKGGIEKKIQFNLSNLVAY